MTHTTVPRSVRTATASAREELRPPRPSFSGLATVARSLPQTLDRAAQAAAITE
jgi:hypothetical protein